LFNTWDFGYSRVVAVGGPHAGIDKWAQGFMTRLTRIFVGRISPPGNVSWLMRSLRRPISGDARSCKKGGGNAEWNVLSSASDLAFVLFVLDISADATSCY
jgi:hypothetical protein